MEIPQISQIFLGYLKLVEKINLVFFSAQNILQGVRNNKFEKKKFCIQKNHPAELSFSAHWPHLNLALLTYFSIFLYKNRRSFALKHLKYLKIKCELKFVLRNRQNFRTFEDNILLGRVRCRFPSVIFWPLVQIYALKMIFLDPYEVAQSRTKRPIAMKNDQSHAKYEDEQNQKLWPCGFSRKS